MNAPKTTRGFSLMGILVVILVCTAGLLVSDLIFNKKEKRGEGKDRLINFARIQPERGLYFVSASGKEVGGWQSYIISDHEGHQTRAFGESGIPQGEEVHVSSVNTDTDEDELFLINRRNAN